MRVISPKKLKEFWTSGNARAEQPLRTWLKYAEMADWTSLNDVRETFPSADGVMVSSGKIVTVFNIAGNSYRLVAAIHYNTGVAYVLRVMTHSEYSKDAWKAQL